MTIQDIAQIDLKFQEQGPDQDESKSKEQNVTVEQANGGELRVNCQLSH